MIVCSTLKNNALYHELLPAGFNEIDANAFRINKSKTPAESRPVYRSQSRVSLRAAQGTDGSGPFLFSAHFFEKVWD